MKTNSIGSAMAFSSTSRPSKYFWRCSQCAQYWSPLLFGFTHKPERMMEMTWMDSLTYHLETWATPTPNASSNFTELMKLSIKNARKERWLKLNTMVWSLRVWLDLWTLIKKYQCMIIAMKFKRLKDTIPMMLKLIKEKSCSLFNSAHKASSILQVCSKISTIDAKGNESASFRLRNTWNKWILIRNSLKSNLKTVRIHSQSSISNISAILKTTYRATRTSRWSCASPAS